MSNASRPLVDQVTGALLALDELTVLVVGPSAHELAGPVDVLSVTYGLRLLDDERLFFPSFVGDDFGVQHAGAALYAWLADNAFMQPRAGVFGVWPGGRGDQIFARDVDVAERPVALAAPQGADPLVAGAPLALAVFALHAGDAEPLARAAADDLPAVLRRCAPGTRLNLDRAPAGDPATRALLRRAAGGGARM
jgi:hypothetical protein